MHWVDGHFTDAGTRRKLDTLTGKGLQAEQEHLHREIDGEHARIEAIEDSRKAVKLCELNTNMIRLAAPILQAEADNKQLAFFIV